MPIDPNIRNSHSSDFKIHSYDEIFELHLTSITQEDKIGKMLTPVPTRIHTNRCVPTREFK